ncbi:hypothetical protein N566_23640 [Streptomycetaceae bacterium MP113-05]|nr:hypothetical protein N566_23640 [Streptomycetaceae bacterium MP113-05]
MTTPTWLAELTGTAEVLHAADRAGTAAWRDGPDDHTVPPLALRLGTLGTAFAEHAHGLTSRRRRTVLVLLEDVLREGAEYDVNAVATGFFEALLNAWDRGFDLHALWADVGPRSRAYCRAWNDFTGVRTPAWMREPATGGERCECAGE